MAVAALTHVAAGRAIGWGRAERAETPEYMVYMPQNANLAPRVSSAFARTQCTHLSFPEASYLQMLWQRRRVQIDMQSGCLGGEWA